MGVAIIGGGGAGLAAAWLLELCHEGTLYEQAERLGGHADTRSIPIGNTSVGIDAGFEFISEAMFPTFCRLLNTIHPQTEQDRGPGTTQWDDPPVGDIWHGVGTGSDRVLHDRVPYPV